MSEKSISNLILDDKIFNLRAHMINLGMKKGLTHPDTIKCSQKLDCILNNLQQIKL